MVVPDLFVDATTMVETAPSTPVSVPAGSAVEVLVTREMAELLLKLGLEAAQAHGLEVRGAVAEARVKVLEHFVDYVLMWRDRGPPHGDPVTA